MTEKKSDIKTGASLFDLIRLVRELQQTMVRMGLSKQDFRRLVKDSKKEKRK